MVQPFLGFLLLGVFVSPVFSAEGTPNHAPTRLEQQRSIEYNKQLSRQTRHLFLNEGEPSKERSPERPFSEIENAGYLLFHADTTFSTKTIKDTLAFRLPAGVKLAVFTDNPKEVSSLKRRYSKLAGKDRVEVLGLKYKASYRAIWARDNTPVPILNRSSDSEQSWGVVDAKYYGGDEPDVGIANWFKVPLIKNPYEFEGGNFVADARGNCVIVNKLATAFIPDTIFTSLYGCQKVVRLQHLAGIGHADERVKFIDEKVVLTDTENYVPELQSLGYEVRLLPKPEGGEYRTYVNSLSVNDTIFVPVFAERNDKQALEVYQSTGKNIVPLDSRTLSDRGYGSIHCITMTYPPMESRRFEDIFKAK